MSEDLNSLVDNHQFSDVVFDVNGQKIHAHRAILVARSQYFRAMFTNCVKENSVNANEVNTFCQIQYNHVLLSLNLVIFAVD